MNAEIFEKILNERIDQTRATLQKKRAEYAPDGGDRLHNFKRAAKMLQCTQATALVGMWAKHLISILDIVDDVERGGMPSLLLIEEKIGDSINYQILLEAALKEACGYAE